MFSRQETQHCKHRKDLNGTPRPNVVKSFSKTTDKQGKNEKGWNKRLRWTESETPGVFQTVSNLVYVCFVYHRKAEEWVKTVVAALTCTVLVRRGGLFCQLRPLLGPCDGGVPGVQALRHLFTDDVHQTLEGLLHVDVVFGAGLKKLKPNRHLSCTAL